MEGKTEMSSDSSDEDTNNPLNYQNYYFVSDISNMAHLSGLKRDRWAFLRFHFLLI